MPKYSEQDLEYAAEFREGVHREALAIVRKTRPQLTEVIDRHPVEDYFQEHWDYPGKWYVIVSIPCGYGSRRALIDAIVRDTLAGNAPAPDSAKAEPGRRMLTNALEAQPRGYRESFVVERDPEKRSFRAVGVDAEGRYILEHFEEDARGGAYYVLTGREYVRYARIAMLNGHLSREDYDRLKKTKPKEDPFYTLIASYPDLAVDYRIVKNERSYAGYASHRDALREAFISLCGDWTGDPERACGKRIDAGELFSSRYREGKLNYRKAFLYPPHGTSCTGRDFARVNEALFPNGTDALEVFEWSTDWSDYFDAGREWWGTLCLTVYDRTLDRFAVILASSSD